jgi:hypothetical protein
MKVILRGKIKKININNMKAITMKKDNMIDLDGIKVMTFIQDKNLSSILTMIKKKGNEQTYFKGDPIKNN